MERVKHQNIYEGVMLPEGLFTYEELDLVELFLGVSREALGETPLLSVGGSYTYARDREGKPIWSLIGDIDFRIYIKDEMFINDQYDDIAIRVSDQIVVLGGSRGPVFPTLVDRFTGKKHEISLMMPHLDWLFMWSEFAVSVRYLPTDMFFGNVDLLNERMSILSKDQILAGLVNWFNYYLEYLEKDYYVERSYVPMDLLKRLYRLSLLIAKEDEYEHLLDFSWLSQSNRSQIFEEIYVDAVERLSSYSDLELREAIGKNFK